MASPLRRHAPSPGFVFESEQTPSRILRRLTHFDTGFAELGENHKLGLRRTVRDMLSFPAPPVAILEGLASFRGNRDANIRLSEARQDNAERFLVGLLLGKVPIADDGGDGVPDAVDMTLLPGIGIPGVGIGHALISNVAGHPVRPVVVLSAMPEGSAAHEKRMREPGYRMDTNDGHFRAVRLSVTTMDRPRPPPPPPIDPSLPRGLDFRIRLADDPLIQPKDFLKLLSNSLSVLKTLPNFKPIAEALERALKRFPRLTGTLGTGISAAKRIKYLLSLMGVAFVFVEIMDDQVRRGGLYLYFGLGLSTDIVTDLLLDQAVDLLSGAVPAIPGVADPFLAALQQLVLKLGLKDLASRLKKLAGSELTGPFPFEPFKAFTSPFVGVTTIGLEDFQGTALMSRDGATLAIKFGMGLRQRRPLLTVKSLIPLRSSGGTSIAGFGHVVGGITMGAPTPFVP